MDISLRGITKQYALKTALDGITFDFAGGNVYAVLGENGAGKSTVAAILCGDAAPSSGSLIIDGNAQAFRGSGDALTAGIASVHQRPLLADSLTVFENIIIGADTLYRRTRKAELKQKVSAIFKNWSPELKLDSFVWQISASGRFFTALACALLKNPSVLILDEPAALLAPEEKNALYAKLKQFAAESRPPKTVIVITHNPRDASRYADCIIVMQKGRIVKTFSEPQAFTEQEYQSILAENASAASYEFMSDATGCRENFPKIDLRGAVSFEGLTVRPKNRPAIFDVTVRAPYGQITCVKGEKTGELETLENVMTGMEDAPCRGIFRVTDGRREFQAKIGTKQFSPAVMRYKQKAAILASDRTFRASNPRLSVEQLLSALYGGCDARSYAKSLIDKAGICITAAEKAANLSGGMLQQLLLRRELASAPEFLLMCEPLQGLDAEAARKMCALLWEASASGRATLILAAADFPDELCARIYRIREGRCTLVKGADV